MINPVVLHVLILWGVLAVALGTLWLLSRLGVSLAGLPYAGVFGFIGAAFGVVVGLTTFFASEHYAAVGRRRGTRRASWRRSSP
jgi:hypothetical protein